MLFIDINIPTSITLNASISPPLLPSMPLYPNLYYPQCLYIPTYITPITFISPIGKSLDKSDLKNLKMRVDFSYLSTNMFYKK
jgi:hypothetical protein